MDEEYEIDHRKLDEEYVQKDWEYQTNINAQTSAASVSCSNVSILSHFFCKKLNVFIHFIGFYIWDWDKEKEKAVENLGSSNHVSNV